MFDFKKVSAGPVNGVFHITVRENYPLFYLFIQEFAQEAEMRNIGQLEGLDISDGVFKIRVLCNPHMDEVALLYMSLCGLNELNHEIEYEREDFRGTLKDSPLPVSG